MDVFRTPGANLEGSDRMSFGMPTNFRSYSIPSNAIITILFFPLDETKELVDSATNDFLVRADWNANMTCVDKVNSIRSASL